MAVQSPSTKETTDRLFKTALEVGEAGIGVGSSTSHSKLQSKSPFSKSIEQISLHTLLVAVMIVPLFTEGFVVLFTIGVLVTVDVTVVIGVDLIVIVVIGVGVGGNVCGTTDIKTDSNVDV